MEKFSFYKAEQGPLIQAFTEHGTDGELCPEIVEAAGLTTKQPLLFKGREGLGAAATGFSAAGKTVIFLIVPNKRRGWYRHKSYLNWRPDSLLEQISEEEFDASVKFFKEGLGVCGHDDTQ